MINQTVELSVESLTSEGDGVARFGGFVVFIPAAAPGDRICAQIAEVRKNYARARLVSVLEPSPHRTEPPCPYFGRCGGCTLQHLDYSFQLQQKKSFVGDAIQRIGGIRQAEISDTLGMASPFHYRNKVQFVASRFQGEFSAGLYALSSHRVVSVENCPLQLELGNRVLKEAVRLIRALGWTAYDEKSRRGSVRHLALRISRSQEAVLVSVVSAERGLKNLTGFAARLMEAVPQVRGVYLNYNPGRTNVVMGSNQELVAGNPYIEEEVAGMRYCISPLSFFQVNGEGAARLAETALQFAGGGGKTALDAFCGAGFFTMFLSKKFERIFGIEEVPDAVRDAGGNARLNGVGNAEFICGRVEEALPALTAQGRRFELALLDPPRKGAQESVLRTLADAAVEKILYVSCNPSTLARDLKILTALGYAVEGVRPVDMFPQTAHVETVVKLQRQDI